MKDNIFKSFHSLIAAFDFGGKIVPFSGGH